MQSKLMVSRAAPPRALPRMTRENACAAAFLSLCLWTGFVALVLLLLD
jgi:hypothetical protein